MPTSVTVTTAMTATAMGSSAHCRELAPLLVAAEHNTHHVIQKPTNEILSIHMFNIDLLGLVVFAAVTPETSTVPKDVPKIEVSPEFSAVTKLAAAVEDSVLSDPVKAMEFATLIEPGVTESIVTLAGVFSNLKMLLSRVVRNCRHHQQCQSEVSE